MAASFEADLAALGARAGPALRAATFHPSAYSSSAGSLADAIMAAAGMRNIAAERGLTGLSRLAGLGRGLDALGLGEDAAASMGVSLGRLRVMAVLGTASAVGGAIGFVGLVVAHLLRPLVGGRPSRLMPAAALGGAAMLLAADVAVRPIAPGQDLKLGVLTAIVGAPFFLWLVPSTRRRLACALCNSAISRSRWGATGRSTV